MNGSRYIYYPKSVKWGKYEGGYDQPIDYMVNRRMWVHRNEAGKLAVQIKGTELAPQDAAALRWFEESLCSTSSTLVHEKCTQSEKSASLKLLVEDAQLPRTAKDSDLRDLLLEAYDKIDGPIPIYSALGRADCFARGPFCIKRSSHVPDMSDFEAIIEECPNFTEVPLVVKHAIGNSS